MGPAVTVYTIGHSTRALDEFVTLLKGASVTDVADIRTVPRSRHNPQFNWDTLPHSLGDEGIRYRHFKGLGGFRHARPDSPNDGWNSPAFRGFADYMGTPEFAEALDELIALAQESPTAIMCAEAVPWRCHRSLVADALVVRGFEVVHILGPQSRRAHELTRFAHVDGMSITYPAPAEEPAPPR